LIPARAGSKRLKNKNVLPLNGKPLIAHSIEAAKQSKYVDEVLVSTDSARIAKVAQRYGAKAPFLRPASISGDRTSDYPVVAHALKWYAQKAQPLDIVVFLRPTVPIRAQGLIDRCIELLVSSKADSVRTVRSVGRNHPYWMLTVDRHGLAKPFLRGKSVDSYFQKQLLPELYEHDGYCDLVRGKNIDVNCSPEKTLQGFYGRKMAVLFNEDGYPLINIDTAEDFHLAEMIIKEKDRCRPKRK
jgi:CMP-N-acetylneuraminic acid synthetase